MEIFKKYIVEMVLISISLVLAIASYTLFTKEAPAKEKRVKPPASAPVRPTFMVDIQGAVLQPGVYTLFQGDRVNDALKKAGGFSASADPLFFAHNFNRARILQDEEKLYIPSYDDVAQGYLEEKDVYKNELVGINSASSAELEALPGIGERTREKIIDNRPYDNLEELLDRKIVNKNVYEQIRDRITIE